MAGKPKFKDRWEMEEEDHMRYRKHQEDTFQRRIAKYKAEGFKCGFDECKEVFQNTVDLALHVQKHNQEYYSQMICNQPKCGKKVNSNI